MNPEFRARALAPARRPAARAILAAALVLLAIYAIAGFLVAPALVERFVARAAQERLGQAAAVARVRVNPFLLTLEADGFALVAADGRPLASFRQLRADLAVASLFRRAWVFDRFEVDGLDARLELAADGRVNFAALAERVAARRDARTAGEIPHVVLRRARINNGRLTFVDHTVAPAEPLVVAPIDLELFDLATRADRGGRYALAAGLPHGGSIAWRGMLSLRPLASAGRVQLTDVDLDNARSLASRDGALAMLQGRLSLGTDYRLAYGAGRWWFSLDGANVRVADARVRLRAPALAVDAATVTAAGGAEVAVDGTGTTVKTQAAAVDVEQVAVGAPNGASRITAASVAGRGVRLDSATRTIAAEAVTIAGGTLPIERAADGTVRLPVLLDAEREAGDREGTQPWHYAIDTIELGETSIAAVDHGFEPALEYALGLSATLANVDRRADSPIRFSIAARSPAGGTATANGTLAQDFGRAEARVEAALVALTPLRPLVARYAAAALEGGTASGGLRVAYQRDGEPTLRVEGSVELADVDLREPDGGDRLVGWRSAATSGLALTLGPGRLDIKEIRIREPKAKIVIDERRRLNLAQLLRARADDARRARADAPPFVARVGRVVVERGTVQFADRSLALPFAARVVRVRGSVLGLSSDPAGRAELRLAGVIAGSGSASAEGGVRIADPAAFTDIRVRFDNVAMPPLSPYSVTFAGRRIESGTLWLDLRYRIVDRQLDSQNRIVLDEFRLGERVAARTALDLPLDLAVAVLTDARGRIDVAVPVTGDLANPRFDYGRLVREALASLITRVATAPFRALERVFGGGGPALGAVEFAPGAAALTPVERRQLDEVATALGERPRLKLVVHGTYDARRDRDALASAQVRRVLAGALGIELRKREDPGPVAYSDAATQIALERLLGERGGPNAVGEVAAEYARRAGRSPQRVNRVLGAFGRASEDRAFYEAVFERLVAVEVVPQADLERLGARRADAIGRYLESTGVASERIENGDVRAVTNAKEPAVAAALELAPIARMPA